MTGCVVVNIHQRDTSHNEIGLCTENMITILGSTVNIIITMRRANYVINSKKKENIFFDLLKVMSLNIKL